MPCKLRAVLFPDAALARRIEAAECRLSLAIVDAVLARGGDAFAVPLGEGAAVFSGSGLPINKVIGAGFGAPSPRARGQLSSDASPTRAAPSASRFLHWPILR